MLHNKKKATRRRHRAPTSVSAPTLGNTVKCILLAVAIAVAIGLLLLFFATALLLCAKDPDHHRATVGLAVAYLTAFCGGLVATLLCHRRSPLLCGLGAALLMILLSTVLSFCLPHEWGQETTRSILLLERLLLLPAATIGAWIPTRTRHKRRR